MSTSSDLSILAGAFLALSETRGGRAWLVTNRDKAAEALLAGKPTIKILATEGGNSTTFDHAMNNRELVQCLTTAIKMVDADDPDKPFDPASPGVLYPVFTRFHH